MEIKIRNYKGKEIWYFPETGILNIRTTPNSDGYIVCYPHNQECVKVHIMAWFIMTGEWPQFKIDHKDRDKSNNRWHNLRPATDSQNKLNTNLYKSNTSSYVGVKRHSTSWCWQIDINGKRIHSGMHKCPTIAAIKRDKYILYNKIEFARLNILVR